MRTKVLWAMLVLFGVQSVATAQELPTVSEIRSHLRKWREGFVAFRVHYQTTYPNSDSRSTRDFLMTDRHDYLDANESFGGWGNPPPSKSVKGGNSEMRFTAGYSYVDDTKTWKLSSVSERPRGTDKVGTAYRVTPLSLLLDPHSGLWMDEFYFDDNRVTVSGREIVDGESCVVLDVTYVYKGEVDGQGSRIWLAEDKNFLIKKVTPNPSLNTGRLDGDYLCAEFRKTGDHWYPYRGQMLLPPDDSQWEVLAFEVNPPVRPQLFKAPSKAGLVKARRLPSGNLVADSSDGEPATKQTLPVAVASGITPQTISFICAFVGIVGLLVWYKLR